MLQAKLFLNYMRFFDQANITLLLSDTFKIIDFSRSSLKKYKNKMHQIRDKHRKSVREFWKNIKFKILINIILYYSLYNINILLFIL